MSSDDAEMVMTEFRVILVRHGRTVGNVARQLAGHFDTPLDEVGRRQAELLAQWWPDGDLHDARIHASDLQRARDTAAQLAARLGKEVEVFPALREIGFGDHEGLAQAELTPEIVAELEVLFSGDADHRLPGGESLREVAARMADHVRTHAGERPLVVVTHGMAISAVLSELTGITHVEAWTERKFEHANTAWSEIMLAPDGSARIVRLSVADHLDPTSAEGRDPWLDEPA